MQLTKRECTPCEGGEDPMGPGEAKRYHEEVPEWQLHGDRIQREWKLDDFAAAIGFVNRIAEVAEDEGHHPDLLLHGWNKVRVTLSTHAIGGLSVNDFIVAAKIDRVAR